MAKNRFKARFNTKCDNCTEPINAGDTAGYSDEEKNILLCEPCCNEEASMIEREGDLWTYPAHVRVITTNGDIKTNGELVMGKGVAEQARDRYPGIAKDLALQVQEHGNVPVTFSCGKHVKIWTFPVKYHYWEPADLSLMESSAKKLMHRANLLEEVWKQNHLPHMDLVVALPRAGCGAGERTWDEVRPLLERVLDDRFHVVTP